MSATTISEAELRRELWESFLSVLRSYFSLHQMGSIPLQDAGPNGQPVIKVWRTVSPATRRLWNISVSYSVKTGTGRWNIFAIDDPGGEMFKNVKTFVLNPDGTVLRDDGNIDMDHAAIDMVACFMDKVNRDTLEVPA